MAVALRIDPAVHAQLAEVAKTTRTSLSQALAAAVESYRRELMIAALDADYAAMRADPKAWAEELRERAVWDQTLADGLAREPPYPLDGLEGEPSRPLRAPAARTARRAKPVAKAVSRTRKK